MIFANGSETQFFQPEFSSTLFLAYSIDGIHSPESGDTRTDTKRNEHSNEHQEISKNDFLANLKYYECYLCKCIKITKYELITHLRVKHTGEEPFSCDQCDKRFASKPYLKQHERSHSDERKFKCNQSDCDKSFKTRATLKQHIERHSDEKKFKCNQSDCDRSFKTRASLSQHNKIHGEKKFKCHQEGCKQSFRSRSNLNKHNISHLRRRLNQKENNNEYLVTQCKNYVCDKCPSAFVQKEQLDSHLKDEHQIDIVHCNICDLPLENEESRREHVNQTHVHRD